MGLFALLAAGIILWTYVFHFKDRLAGKTETPFAVLALGLSVTLIGLLLLGVLGWLRLSVVFLILFGLPFSLAIFYIEDRWAAFWCSIRGLLDRSASEDTEYAKAVHELRQGKSDKARLDKLEIPSLAKLIFGKRLRNAVSQGLEEHQDAVKTSARHAIDARVEDQKGRAREEMKDLGLLDE